MANAKKTAKSIVNEIVEDVATDVFNTSKFAVEHPEVAALLLSMARALFHGHNATEKAAIMQRVSALLDPETDEKGDAKMEA